MTSRERRFAKYLKEKPTVIDWIHYNFYVSSSFIGVASFVEYGFVMDNLNM